jgi:hypothetical protein
MDTTTDANELSVKTDNEIDHFRDTSSYNSSFLVSEVDFSLGGGETTMVSLFWNWISIQEILSWLKVYKSSCIIFLCEILLLYFLIEKITRCI